MASIGGPYLHGSAGVRIAALLMCALMVLSAAPFVAASPRSSGDVAEGTGGSAYETPEYMNYIHINSLKFDPLADTPDIPDSLSFSAESLSGHAYYIVQLKGPVTVNMKAALSATGVSILHYINYNAFVVGADPQSLADAKGLWCVRWAGVFEPAYKLSPRLSQDFDALQKTILSSTEVDESAPVASFVSESLSASVEDQTHSDVVASSKRSSGSPAIASSGSTALSSTSNRGGSAASESYPTSITVEIVTFEDSCVSSVAQALYEIGASDIVYTLSGSGELRATLDRGAAAIMASEMGVMWVDRYAQPYVFNDVARWVVQSDDSASYATPVHDQGIWGTNQTVTVCDSGLDFEHDAFEDTSNNTPGPDHRKVTDYYVPSDAGGDYADQGINHGTHVSGTVAGDDGTWHYYDGDPTASSGSAGPHDGQAFDAYVQMQDISTDPYYVYPPSSIADGYAEALSRGSYIHTNSWGSDGAAYIQAAADTDEFIWNNQDFIVLYAAGNPGSGLGWINPYSTAKNAISVGASLNGVLSDNLADFSGRGPAADGRIKPDVVAPGVEIWSAQGGDPGPELDTYFQLSGTSMATPCVAGTAALIRQYFMDGFYPTGEAVQANGFTPSSALVKAVLINGAAEMTGTDAYDNGQTRYPNFNQGWGRLVLDDALSFKGDSRGAVVVDDRYGMNTGSSVTYQLAIGSGGMPVEITLVWSDYPGTPMSDPNIVNDLDLRVTAPDGTVYLGNVYEGFNPGESVANPNASDHLNNVEGVLVISGALSGLWTVQVIGYNVPMGPQPFALVMTGAIATQAGVVQMDNSTCQSSARVNITVVDIGLDLDPNASDTATVEMSSDTENVPEIVTLTETAPSSSVFRGWIQLENSATPAGDGVLQVLNGDIIEAAYFDAKNGLGGSGYTYDYALVDDDAPAILNVQVVNIRFSRATVTWTTDEPSDSVVYWGAAPPPMSITSTGLMTLNHSIMLGSLEANSTYYVAVQSSDQAGNTVYDDNGTSYYRFTTPERPPVAPPSEEWPTFHNNEPRQGYSPAIFTPPLRGMWSDGDRFGIGWAGPVMADGLLYTTGWDGYIRARNAYTGDVIWERRLGGVNYYTNSPTVVDGVVYVHFTTSGNISEVSTVYALDGATGETIWANDQYFYSARAVSAYSDGMLFAYTWNNEIVALDALTGDVEWVHVVSGYVFGGPTVTGGVSYQAVTNYNTESYTLLALDASSGTQLWSKTLDDIAVGPPLYAQGMVYIGTYGGTMYALDSLTGAVIWSYHAIGMIDFGTPAYDGVAIFYVDLDGVMRSLDATDGSVLWARSVGYASSCAPAYANGFLYVTSWDGNLYTVDAFDGTILESHFLGSSSTSSPAVSDGWVWVESNEGACYGFLGQIPVGVIVKPSSQSRNTLPDSTVDYRISVTNVGVLGSDTFDINIAHGAIAWTTNLYDSDGTTILTDTDSDGVVDTGSIAPMELKEFVVRVSVPSGALAGDSDAAILTFNSSADPLVSMAVRTTTTVPLPGVDIEPRVYLTASPGELLFGTLDVINTGGFPDTFDITASSLSGWSYELLNADGVTPLGDTDLDGIPDTGEIPGLGSAQIVVSVEVPSSAVEGDVERITVTASSSLDALQHDSTSVVAELTPPLSDEWPTLHNNNARLGLSPSIFSPPIEQKWMVQGDGDGSELNGPVVSNGVLYYTSEDGYIRARGSNTGTLLWERELGGLWYYTGTPAVDDCVVYITFYDSSGGYVYALDGLTGDTIWSVSPSSDIDFNARACMAVEDGLVFGVAWSGEVFALDASDGSIVWSYQTGERPYGGVAMGADTVFVGSLEGSAFALDIQTGSLLWSALLDGGECTAPPLYAQGALYIGTTLGNMFALDASSGSIIWSTDMGAPISFSTPAYDGLRLYFGTTGMEFYAVDPADGSILWSTGVPDWVQCSPAVANGFVYATVWSGELMSFDASNGSIVDVEELNEWAFTTSPAVVDGWVWVTDYSGDVICFKGQMPYGIQLSPVSQTKGAFPPDVVDYEIVATNIGFLGPDTFDVTLTPGIMGWPTELLQADGVTPLADTDGDAVPDTGALESGSNATVVVRVTVPGDAGYGDSDMNAVVFASSSMLNLTKQAKVVATVPLPGVRIGMDSYVSVVQGEILYANVTVKNTGGLSDTIGLQVTADPSWSVVLVQEDGVTPLIDTDGDLVIDTGLMAGDADLFIRAVVTVPVNAPNGAICWVTVAGFSSFDPNATDLSRLILEVSPGSGSDWPQFQHDASRSGVCPLDLEPSLEFKWSVNPDAYYYPTWHGPVISGGLVYTSSSSGYITAFDLTTGAIEWRTKLGIEEYQPSAPTVAYGNVYCVFLQDWSSLLRLYCLNAETGAVVWTEDGYSSDSDLRTSVVAAQGMVFWNDLYGHFVYAHDAFTGDILWSYHTLSMMGNGPAYWGGMVFLAEQSRKVTCLDALTGEVVWKIDVPDYVGAPMSICEGALYMGDYNGTVCAVDAWTGTLLWETSLGDYIDWAAPVVAEGLVFIGTGSYPDGLMFALNVTDGSIVWSAFTSDGPIYASAAYANGIVFCAADNGHLYAWDALTGDLLQEETVVEWEAMSSCALGNGYLVLTAGDGSMVAFGFEGVGQFHHIMIAPEEVEVQVTGATVFEAQALDVYGNSLEGVSLSWTSTNGLGTVFPISDDGTTAVYVAGTEAGVDTVRVMSSGSTSEATVNILPGASDSMSVLPATASLVVGTTAQFSASVLDRYGNALPGIEVNWSVLGGVGGIDGNGLFSAGTVAGTTVVEASAEGLAGYAQVVVIPGALDALVITPGSIEAIVGGVYVLRVQGYDAYDNLVSSPLVSWLTSVGTVLPTSADGGFAMFSAGTVTGSGEIQAVSGSVVGIAAVDVISGSVNRIVLSPSEAAVEVGRVQVFSATALDVYGNTVQGTTLVWSASDDIGTMSQLGILTASTTAGSGTVTVSAGSVSASASITITPGAATLTVSPGTLSLAAGGTASVSVAALDAYGNTVPGMDFTWSSTIGSMSADDGSGHATFLAGTEAGTGAITVSSGTQTKTISVTVVAGPLASIVVEPTAVSLGVGENQSMTAKGYDAYGNQVVGLNFSWSLSDADLGTITTTGADAASANLEAANGGSGTISVDAGGKSVQIGLTIDEEASALTKAAPTLALVALILAAALAVLLTLLIWRRRSVKQA